ncbi:aldehyde oxidase [Sarcophilus harrisii]|uniref:aldehyde oxidase n=1 Tax=Sarcophilus harrisii TaxID=9305 RepID=A0A7N4UZY8_SARHA|nr:aldehyde oxidase [Sarcophilus harrisii]DAA64452.1 TPA_inf: aldehyde oxidase 1 [Sarcophilus harrisii]
MPLALNGPSELLFYVNGRKVREKNADPETMLLSYLRKKLRLTGTKYGCGGGGCGACTVMISRYDPGTKKIRHYSANACLLSICSLYGTAVTTVEGIGNTKTRIHPVQERIAKCHGTQCGFCSPGMVMSLYSLLRNIPKPSMDQLMEALGGNLCRCTGYRPIVDACKTFCKTTDCCQGKENGICCFDQEENELLDSEQENMTCEKLFQEEEFLPLDPTQEFIFPPELMLMAEKQTKTTRVFYGERITWISPVTLRDLLEVKAKYPDAPIVMGNTTVGPDMKFKGIFHSVIISPDGIAELNAVNYKDNGLTIGAGCSLAQLKDILTDMILELPVEKTQTYRALLKHLRTLAGSQIRNVASLGGNIISRHSTSDLNPLLAVGNCTLNLASKDGKRQIPLNDQFLMRARSADLKPEEILVSVNIPYSRKWEFVSAFRQAPRQQNALAIVNSGMRVLFEEDTNIIRDICIFYGGIGTTTVCAKKICQKLIGRAWNEEMLGEACKLVLAEVLLPGSAPGGMVEYKRSLIVSFLFKFYIEVLQNLKMMNPSLCPSLPDGYGSVLEDFHSKHYETVLRYQKVDTKQFLQDPVGRPIMHLSGINHATGEAIYCDDIPAHDQELFLAFVTSSRAHAKIVSIDTSEALKLPGVIDVLTGKDLQDVNSFKSFLENEKILATDEVLGVGQIVGAVIADSDIKAKQAAHLVKIEYSDLKPVILTIEEAIQHKSFYEPERKIEYGDVDEAFKAVDQILEGEIHIGGQEHFYMETQSMLVVPYGEDKEMDIYVSTQFPRLAQDIVASILKVPSNKIMCHVKRVGGAFGGKASKTGFLAAITAFAANKTGCPVRCILERGEDILITGGRHPYLGKYKVGFMNDGRIIALDVVHYANSGFTLDLSLFVIEMGLLKLDNAYKIPNLRCRALACKTNLPSNTAFRGFGYPQVGLIMESCIMKVAAQSGLPPEKVRMINMYKEMDETHYKQEINAKNLIKCWNECMEISSYYARKAMIEDFNKKNYWKKKGIALIPMKFPIGLGSLAAGQAAALVHVYLDGSVLVTHCGIEMGQGVHTKMIQVVSRELGMPMDNIHLRGTSTETVPNANASGGSVVADLNGMALQDACQILRKRLEPIISKNPHGTWKEWAQEAFNQSISLSATGYFRGYESDMDWEKGEGHPFTYFVYGTACSEVEVDCLTGDHKNIRTDIVMDVGHSINPALDIGQVEGAFIQGVGLYTLEELKYSPEGILYTRGPEQYKIPSFCDVPNEFNVYFLPPSEVAQTLYSSKGLGESALFLGSSVFFALHDAIRAARQERGFSGVFTLNSPLTPEKIRMACEDKFTKMIPKDEPGSYVPWDICI